MRYNHLGQNTGVPGSVSPINQQLNNPNITNPAMIAEYQANRDKSLKQLMRAIQDYNIGIQPFVYTVQQAFTAASTVAAPTFTVDASYAFICNYLTAILETATTDRDLYLTGLSLSSQTVLMSGNLPIGLLTRYTGFPLPFILYVPPNNQVIVNLQNGSTTAATTVDLVFWGYRVPAGQIEQIKAQLNKLNK